MPSLPRKKHDDELTIEAVKDAYLKATNYSMVPNADVTELLERMTEEAKNQKITASMGRPTVIEPHVNVDMFDPEAYTQSELNELRQKIDDCLTRSEVGALLPTPPKFANEADADAWMEEHYG